MIRLDFTKEKNAQDMIRIIMQKYDISAEDAVVRAVNKETLNMVLSLGYGQVAYSLWGHAEPDKEFLSLNDPIINAKFREEQELFIATVMTAENISIASAVCCFLIMTMSSMGYHI